MNASVIASLDRPTALRIALAARALPEVGVGRLLEALHRRIEGPITLDSLKTVTVTDIRNGLAGADGEDEAEDPGLALPAIKEAVRILWGEDEPDALPPLQPRFGPGVPVVTVAVASNAGERIDGHFGSCLRFLVYQLSREEARLVDLRSTLEADLAEDRNAFRAGLVADCDVLFVQSIGGPAAAKVVKAGLYPVKVRDAVPAREELARLQSVMDAAPPPWLAKIMGVGEAERARFRSEETTG